MGHVKEMRKQNTLKNVGKYTPKRKGINVPKRRLYRIAEETDINNIEVEINTEVIPIGTDLEVLLINSCKITAMKVQNIINEFMIDKEYTTFFCMTETKVRGHDFKPEGVKMFSKHRNGKGEKKGGGLALGYAESANIKLEEIEIKSNDILALEGTINGAKCRIILCYFNCSKAKKGEDFEKNRTLQKEVEKLMEVDPNINLIVLGDFNGRLTSLEPDIKSDSNGLMIEKWIDKHDIFHLNALITCTGKYTFESANGKSAIDHVLTNGKLYEKHIGMWIDEDKIMLNISDHNLVRAWFKVGTIKPTKKKKKNIKEITWISRDPERIDKCVVDFKKSIGKKINFKKCMTKMSASVNFAMKRKLRRRPGGKKKIELKAATWVDTELKVNIKLRSKLSRAWRHARKREEPKEVLDKYRDDYFLQKSSPC